MDSRDPTYRDPNEPMDDTTIDDSRAGDGEHHATTGGSALAGAITGGVIGTAAGPVGTAVGAVGGAIVGAITERVMHSDDDREGEEMGLDNDRDHNPMIESREKEGGGMDTERPYAPGMDTSADAGRTVRLREEELLPRKETVETGQVEIRKEVVTENRSVEVPVTREEVSVERHPVDRRPSDKPIGRADETITVPVREEQVTVEKRPVVTEEISVQKRPVTETREVSGTVRREEAHVDRQGTTDQGYTDRSSMDQGSTDPNHEHHYLNGVCSCGMREPM